MDAAACLVALLDGTADAVATDHAPHTEVDKAVEFGSAANGISGIETALGLLLELVDAGQLPLSRAIEALTVGPARILGERSRRVGGGRARRRRARGPRRLRSLGALDGQRPRRCCRAARTRRCSGSTCRAGCSLTMAGGRVAYEAPDA